MLQCPEVIRESCKEQQLLDDALAKLDVEQANNTRLQLQHGQMEADYAELQQELTKAQGQLAEKQVYTTSQPVLRLTAVACSVVHTQS